MLWAALAVAVGVVGAAVCLLKLTWSVAGLVGLGIAFAVVLLRSPRSSLAAAVTSVGLLTLVIMAVLGWSALLDGRLSLGLLAGLGLLSPGSLQRCHRFVQHLQWQIIGQPGRFPNSVHPTWTHKPPSSAVTDGQPTSTDPATSVTDVQALTDAQLSQEWRRSCVALLRLQSTRNIRRQAELVERRQTYLDELEKRSPAGFARSLATEAQPGSDPLRFIVADQRDTRPGRPEPPAGGAAEEGASADAG